ncbi:MAG: hypothetical protein ACWGQW_01390 [bacterium]
MADYVGNVIDPQVENGFSPSNDGNTIDPNVLQGFANPIEATYDIIQRIWDTTVGWVQYTQATFNPTPAPGDTEPNHTGNLVASTHHVLGEVAS